MRALENPEKWSELLSLMDAEKYDEAREICKKYFYKNGHEAMVRRDGRKSFKPVYHIKNEIRTYYESIQKAANATGVSSGTVCSYAKSGKENPDGNRYEYVEVEK